MKKRLVSFMLQIIESPFALLAAWLGFLLIPLITFFRFFLISNEFYIDPLQRFFLNIFLFSFRWFITVYSISALALWVWRYNNAIIPKSHRIVLAIMALSGSLLFIFNSFLLRQEDLHYPNFLYSKLGLTYSMLESLNQITLAVLVLIILLFFHGGRLFVKFSRGSASVWKTRLLVLLKLAIIFIFLFALSRSFYPLANFSNISKQSRADYHEKLGPDYVFVEALKEATPQESVVIHPPQNDRWPLIGNQPAIRYFLFPRTLVSGVIVEEIVEKAAIESAYFIEIHPDSPENRWPLISTVSASVSFDETTYLPYLDLEVIDVKDTMKIYRIVFYD